MQRIFWGAISLVVFGPAVSPSEGFLIDGHDLHTSHEGTVGERQLTSSAENQLLRRENKLDESST